MRIGRAVGGAKHRVLTRVRELRKARIVNERARRIARVEHEVRRVELARSRRNYDPIVLFDPTSHMMELTVNAAAALLAGWALRLSGCEVRYLVCHGALTQCVLGTSRRDPLAPPPCAGCVAHNSRVYPKELTVSLPGSFGGSGAAPAELSLDELLEFRYGGLDLGAMCLPSTRWVLGRQDLTGDPVASALLGRFVASSVNVAGAVDQLINELHPRALILFNGTFYPEAVTRAVAIARGIDVTTYESGFRPLSVFWSHGLATEYEVGIPQSFTMGAAENEKLDTYLAQRFKGDFTMAGVRFWPEMQTLPPTLKEHVSSHRQVVTVFTNVAFDTSQTYANTLFRTMFDWLDETLRFADAHPDTLFIVRVHPEEARPYKESREPVEEWMVRRGYDQRPNVLLIGPTDYVSSYELMRIARLCLVYNSTVALEATLLGTPVVMGGKARYSSEAVAHTPSTADEYREIVSSLLREAPTDVSPEWKERARRYLYYSFYRTSLELGSFIEPLDAYDHTLRPFPASALHPDNSEEMRIICDGILGGQPFHY